MTTSVKTYHLESLVQINLQDKQPSYKVLYPLFRGSTVLQGSVDLDLNGGMDWDDRDGRMDDEMD